MGIVCFVALTSTAGAVAACGLDEQGILALGQPDGAFDSPRRDVQAGDAHGRDAATSDVRVTDARKDAPHEADAKGGDTGGGDAGGSDTGADTGGTTCPTTPDCSNAACKAQGYVCTPPAPGGWSMAAVDFTTDVPCPPGYGASSTVVTAPTGGPASCGCSCSLASSPSCNVGNIDIAIGSGSCGGTIAWAAADGVCTGTSTSFDNLVQVTSTPGAVGGTCSGTPTKTVPASGSSPAYVCPATGSLSTKGCTGGDVCVAVGSTEAQCIVQSGSTSCAGPYSTLHAVGSSVIDTRTCSGSCVCGAPTATCDNQTWTFYTNAGCTGPSTPVNMDGKCDHNVPTPTNSYLSYRYSADPAGVMCGTPSTSPTASGSLTLAAPQTLCCLP